MEYSLNLSIRILIKKCSFVLIGIMILGTMVGCSNQKKEYSLEEKDGSYKVYYMDSSESKIVCETFQPESEATEQLIWECIQVLKKEPKNITYKSVLPAPIDIVDFTLQEKGQLTLNFNEAYSTLNGISEILSRAAIVKTISQVEGVNYIEFYVNGQPLMLSADKSVGFMTPEDFIDNTGEETNFYQNATVTLFFATSEGKTLQEVRVNIVYDGTISMEQLIVQQLIAGPSSISGVNTDRVLATVPPNTKLIKISVKDGICYLDLSNEFIEKIPDISNEVAIYSIVNSLVELANIDKVQFSINGEQRAVYRDGMIFNVIFERNLDLVE